LEEEEAVPNMLAPDDWNWCFYTITHFNTLKYGKTCLKHVDDDADFVHSNKSTDVGGWQDYMFQWLTVDEDKKFAHPGPAVGRRGESLHLSVNQIFNFFSVGVPSSVFDKYSETGVLPVDGSNDEDADGEEDEEINIFGEWNDVKKCSLMDLILKR
jgi:hypothetical protein